MPPEGSVAGVADPGGMDKPSRGDATAAPDGKKATRAAELLGELGDYELLEEIGRGGQGVVFRARQKSLNRTVALKVISLGQWASKAHLKRFRLEAEAAARLEHPGIVPIHEVGERDGQCYFSMKFIEGGQLDEVTKRAPMSIRQAVELIAKVTRTVHYAHEHGILHRDIKPGNILLDQKGEPHLTDFGLARLVETESTVTRTMEVLGTPSYMAPEQAVGNNAAVGSATDVYGLGAVIYQLLTGQPPFAGGTTYETIKLLLDTEPRQPRLLNPKIDRDLSIICLKCLEKDPKRRYSSALALAEDLEHWLKHEPILARHTGIFTRGRKWMRRNPTSALLAASLIALAAAAGWIVWKSELIRQPVTNGIAVLPFENLSPDPDNAYFAGGIQDEILTRLASIANLKVISRTSTQRYQSKPRNLAEIAKELGVANILEGSVQRAADQVRVNVQLINAQTDSHLWADTYDRTLTDIFGVESEIAKRIAESLQAKLTGREEHALAVKPTNNPEAYDAYLRGLAFEARNGAWIDLLMKAIGFYEQAVQLDPKFALAWARLSRADALLYYRNARSGDNVRDAAKKALENAQKLEPNSAETLLALGCYQRRVLADDGLAKTTFTRVSKMLPGNSEVISFLATIALDDGQWDQSITYFEKARALDPLNAELLADTAWTYGVLRQFPMALKLYDQALDISPNDPDVMASKAGIYQAQGNLEQAARCLSQITAQTPGVLESKINQFAFERNYGEAIRLVQARLARLQTEGAMIAAGGFESETAKATHASLQLYLAMIQLAAGDSTGAKFTAEQARNTLEGVRKTQSDHPAVLLSLAQANALMGEKDSGREAAQRAIMLFPVAKDALEKAGLQEQLALVQTSLGENSGAISTLAELLHTPYSTGAGRTPITPALLRLDPIWDPLRSEPAFQKLCEEKQP
ncbi:MAG: tetratricopeptide repeat protein [Verrucomicrobia bacterium]|nr:MAG: tetratricopeptide repeat protein [Verrucomicrobiota bacterium]